MKFSTSGLDHLRQTSIREYAEGESVQVGMNKDGRLVIVAWNEAGHNGTEVDLLDVLDWVHSNRPDLLGSRQG